MKVKVETELFKGIIKAVCMNGLIETPVIKFGEDCVEAMNQDIANVAMSVCRFDKDTFLEYGITGEEEKVAIEADKTLKLIRNLSGDEVTIEKTDSSLLIKTDSEKLKIPIIESNDAKLPQAILVRKEDGIVYLNESMEFQLKENIPVLKKELEGLGERVTVFELKDKELSVRQETTDGYSFQSSIMKDVNSDDFSVMFDTDYLKNVFDSLIDGNVLLNLGKESVPIVLQNNTNNYRILVLLLPRIDTGY